jgi:hypothetical protein
MKANPETRGMRVVNYGRVCDEDDNGLTDDEQMRLEEEGLA